MPRSSVRYNIDIFTYSTALCHLSLQRGDVTLKLALVKRCPQQLTGGEQRVQLLTLALQLTAQLLHTHT